VIAEPVRRRFGVGLAVSVALVTSLLLSACAAGQSAQTANEKPTLDGTYASVGNIDLRGLAVEAPNGRRPYYAAGSDARIKLVIVNSGQKADSLTSITSPAAGAWGAFASSSDANAAMAADTSPRSTPTPPAATSSAASQSPSRKHHKSSGASASASTTPAPPNTSIPAPTPITQVPIAPGSRVSWGVPEATGALLLLHIKKRIYPGSTIPITFTFATAGTVTVSVPIMLSNTPGSSTVPEPAATSSIPA
jgi:copper(I)-binding protein